MGFKEFNSLKTRAVAIEVIVALQKAKAGVPVVPTTKDDFDNWKNKRLRMKAKLDAEPKVQVFVPLEPKEKPGKVFLPVTLNGYRIDVPKGVPTMQPKSVADVIYEHLQLTAVAGQRFLADRDEKVADALS